MLIITPCSRPENLGRLFDSIDFTITYKWVIVYDGNKLSDVDFQFESHPKIIEVVSKREGKWGNPMRNEALDICQTFGINHYVYFLDDDNVIHPNLWRIIKRINCVFVTFDMTYSNGKVLSGRTPRVGKIDTSMFIVKLKSIGSRRWSLDEYHADGLFIEGLYEELKDGWEYLPVIGSYYNRLR
jgi:hypothetical protein